MSNTHLILLIAGAILSVPGVLVFFVIRDTLRGRGKWGINIARIHCPNCNAPLPLIRRPQNERQRLWGGGTCSQCNTEVDKWGHRVDQP